MILRRHPLAPRLARRWRALLALSLAVALAACEGGSGQSGSAFVFVTVDGFSTGSGGGATSSVTAAVNTPGAPATSASACVTLRNNLKNPTITLPSALDNVVIQSYTVTLQGIAGPFTFGTAVLVPAGSVAQGALTNNTATFSVIVVPGAAKRGVSAGTTTVAQITFRGRDGRGSEVRAEGAVTVLFDGTDSTCGAAPAPPTNGNGTNGTNGTT